MVVSWIYTNFLELLPVIPKHFHLVFVQLKQRHTGAVGVRERIVFSKASADFPGVHH